MKLIAALPRMTGTVTSHATRLNYAGDIEIDPASGDLMREGKPVSLRAQTARLLHLLVRHRSRLVTRDEIRTSLWGDSIGYHDEGINACIRELRRALGDSPTDAVFIETAPKRGYRWVAVEQTVEIGPATDTCPRIPRRRPVATRLVLAVTAVIMIGFGVRFTTRNGGGLLVVVRPSAMMQSGGSDSLARALKARLDAIGLSINVETASTTTVLDVERRELHRAGERRPVTYVLELPPYGRDGSVYLFRGADRSMLWMAAAESPSLVDSIADVIVALK